MLLGTILNTRPEMGVFDDLLREAGRTVLHVPMLRIEDPEHWDVLDAALDRPAQWDGILLTSPIAARYFARRVEERHIDPTDLPPLHTIGTPTAAAARRGGLLPATIAASSYGADMPADLGDVSGRRYLQPCSPIARDEIVAAIEQRGGHVEQIATYRVLPPDADAVEQLRHLVAVQGFDCVAFFSPSAVQHFRDVLPDFAQGGIAVAVIGRTTGEAATSAGLRVDILPALQSAEAVAEAILHFGRSDQ
jgi:uroporphyrinogen-III synthase